MYLLEIWLVIKCADFIGDSLDMNKLCFHRVYPIYGCFMELFKSIVGFRITRRMGCAMAFHSSLKKILLPFPSTVTQHDIYIANAASLLNTYYFIDCLTLFHRIHNENVSSKIRRPMQIILIERIKRLISLILILPRIFKHKSFLYHCLKK